MSDTTVTTRPSSMGRTAVKRIAVTGASGLVGGALIAAPRQLGGGDRGLDGDLRRREGEIVAQRRRRCNEFEIGRRSARRH